MKKQTNMLLILLCLMLLMISGCGEKIASIQSVIDGEESFPQEFQGIERKSLNKSWGEPVVANEHYDLWEVDGKYVQAYYENDAVTSVNRSSTLRVKIIEILGASALAEPEEGQWERNSADRIYIPLSAMNSEVPSSLSVGDVLEIEYNGLLMETYPAQIGEPYSIKLVSED